MTPKKGGTLNFVVAQRSELRRPRRNYLRHDPPHPAFLQPVAPDQPDNPQSATDFLCDVCEGKVLLEGDEGSGGKQYTFKIRKGIEFHTVVKRS